MVISYLKLLNKRRKSVDSLSAQKLQELAYDFYNLAGMKFCIYDAAQNELCYYPEKLSPFCELLRSNKEMDLKCRECDRLAFAQCKLHRKRFVHTCHAGLTECFAPIICGEEIIGYIALGQIKTAANSDFSSLTEKLPSDLIAGLSEKYNNLPVTDIDKINSAMHILDACTGYEYLKSLIGSNNLAIDARIASYVESNLSGDLSVAALCSRFHLSRNEIYDIFHKHFDSSVADFVKERRLNKACSLLENTTLSVSKIAELCGIPDYNYFSKQFHKAFGASPTSYRKSARR